MLKLLGGWALMALSPFVMLAATSSAQTPLLIGFGMTVVGIGLLESEMMKP